MSQEIQIINNWSDDEVISFASNYNVCKEPHGEEIIKRLIHIAEHNPEDEPEDYDLEGIVRKINAVLDNLETYAEPFDTASKDLIDLRDELEEFT